MEKKQVTTNEQKAAENTQVMTNEQMENELRGLRIGAGIFKIVSFVAFAIAIIPGFIGRNMVIFIVCGLVGALCSLVSDSKKQSIKKILSDNIISITLREALGDGVEYDPNGRINPGSMVFPFSYNAASGSDHIKAVYNGLKIELGDIDLLTEKTYIDEDGNESQKTTSHFKGQWLICDFGKELAGEVFLSENDLNMRLKHKDDSVDMENEAFNKRFLVTSKNPQEAYYILTPHTMEYILSMANKSGGKVYMTFLRDGKLHVAVQTGKDFFELGKSRADVDQLRQKFLDELKWFTDIIDTLRAENTLYKKVTNI